MVSSEAEGWAEALRRIAQARETRAEELDLGGLMLREVPGELQALGWLKRLYLGPDVETRLRPLLAYSGVNKKVAERCNALGAVPEVLFHALGELEQLDLALNALAGLPASIAGLTALTSLNLSDNEIGAAGAAHLAGLTALTTLNLWGNAIGAGGAAHLAGLTALTALNLWYNGIGAAGAAHLAGLTALTSLDLGYNGDLDAAPLYRLRNLKTRNAAGCTFERGFGLFHMSFVLEKLILHKTYIPGVPTEVLSTRYVDNCLDRLLAHVEDLAVGAAEIDDVKFMILGNGRIGKTEICRQLRGEPYVGDETKLPSTHGVQVRAAPLAMPAGERPVTLRMWDFGGQDIYHGTHALFLKSRAIFPVVWTPTAEAEPEHTYRGFTHRNQPLGYWLAYVKALGGRDSPVIVIQSQCDTPDLKAELPATARAALGGIKPNWEVQYSAKTNRGRGALDDALREAAGWLRNTQGVGQTGKGRAEVKRRLEAMAEAAQHDPAQRVLPWGEFVVMCEEVAADGRFGPITSARALAEFLHNIGTVFWRDGLFDDALIVDQGWVLDAVYAVFDREQATFKDIECNLGRFTRIDLARTVWAGRTDAEQALFLGFMQQCGICFPLRVGDTISGSGSAASRDAARHIETEYIAPDLLPDREHPTVAIELAQKWDAKAATETATIPYELLPPGLLRGLMAKIGEVAGLAGEYWRDGFYFWDQQTGARALVEQRRPGEGPGQRPGDSWSGEIVVSTQQGRSAELLDRLLKWIDEDRVGLGARAKAEGAEGRRARDSAARGGTIMPAHAPSNAPDGKEWFVSYAWKDDTPEGRDREREVDRLCAEAGTRGRRIIRDKHDMSFGDRISEFMDRMAKGAVDGRVFIVLSDKYLRSPYCMTELYETWRYCRQDPALFNARTRVFVLPSARIGTEDDCFQYTKHWLDKWQTDEARLLKHGSIAFSDDGFKEHTRAAKFYHEVRNILRHVADTLAPRDFDAFLQHGFEDGPGSGS